MADNDPYGLWGDAGGEDRFGLWGGKPSKAKKRVRTKRPQAREVESPVSSEPEKEADEEPVTAESADEDKYGLRPRQGPPPGPAGSPSPRPGRDRESAWYEPLLDSALSFGQGVTQNWGDEAAGAARWALGKAGVMRDLGSLEENQAAFKASADQVTRDYPVGHGAGQAAAGMALGAAVPGGAVAQGLTAGALSGASEYGDSRHLGRTAGMAALGGAAGAGGAALGNRLARTFATSPRAAQEVELQAIQRASSSRPPAPPAQWPPAHPGIAPEVGPPRPQALPPPAATPEPPVPTGPEYYRGQLDMTPPPKAPASAPPVEATYEPPGGDWTADVLSTPPPRAPSLPEASERELQQLALRRAQQNMPPDKLGEGLRGLSNGAAMLGQGQAALALRGGALASRLLRPGAREAAIFQGELVPNAAAAMRTRMGSEMAWEMGAPAAYGGKVNAQDGEPVAYADQNTTNYALSEVLSRGRTGLSQQDEETLTSAVVRGDDDAIRAADFRMRQKYPAYARQVERALRGLNEED